MNQTNEMNQMNDFKKTQLYLLNGIVCDYFDGRINPTIAEIKSNWQFQKWNLSKSISDTEIEDMINRVAKYYR